MGWGALFLIEGNRLRCSGILRVGITSIFVLR